MKYSRNIQVHKEESELETWGLKRIKTHDWVLGVTGDKEYSIGSSGVKSKSSFGSSGVKSKSSFGKVTWKVCGTSRWRCQQAARKMKNENPGAWERGQV